jgi:secreted trypsin-like serine protease
MRKLLISVLGALALAFAFVMPANAIVGGAPEQATYPWMGSMQQAGNHGCGASLISDVWAMTAFHCVQGWMNDPALKDQVQLRFGSNNHKTGGTLVGVTEVHIPPGARLDGADIALMKLAAPVPGPYATLTDVSPAIGSKARLIGWGVTCTQSLPPIFYCGQSPDMLHGVEVPLVADLNCTSIIYGIAGRSELCLGNYFSGKTACYGDSGGPAIIGDRVAGVTSRSGQVWLYGNCQLAPIIYTDVTFFRPWIKDVSGV